MAVFRVAKTKNYTVMSNHHLRDNTISLKAKGLLSLMLSLPEDWDYTLAGLSRINKESVEAVRTAVLELEKARYIVRRQLRDSKGKMANTEYTIYELPQTPTPPKPENKATQPSCGFPMTGKPTAETPMSENAAQQIKELPTTDSTITDSQNTPPLPFPSPHQCRGDAERNGKGAPDMTAFDAYRETIRENLDYPIMTERYKYDRKQIDEIVDLILETVCTSRKTLRIAGDDYPAELVKGKFLKLNSQHLEFVLGCLKENTTEIRNIKKYLLAVLFNAPSTIDNYVSALVARNTASAGRTPQ
jgi:hypothetical protein